jgi:hypothetical protein
VVFLLRIGHGHVVEYEVLQVEEEHFGVGFALLFTGVSEYGAAPATGQDDLLMEDVADAFEEVLILGVAEQICKGILEYRDDVTPDCWCLLKFIVVAVVVEDVEHQLLQLQYCLYVGG